MRFTASRAWLSILTVLFLAGCVHSPTGPAVKAALGTYALVPIDGIPLPTPDPAGGQCPASVLDGQLNLGAWKYARSPFYTAWVNGERGCVPASGNSTRIQLINDYGDWSAAGDRLQFKSKHGFGIYTGAGRPPATEETEYEITTVLQGHTYLWRRVLLVS